MKALFCKYCGNMKLSTGDICVICDGTEFEEKDLSQAGATCTYCGKVASEAAAQNGLPFYNAKNHTFYCGCKGWD